MQVQGWRRVFGGIVVAAGAGMLGQADPAQAAIVVQDRSSMVDVFAHAIGQFGSDGGQDTDTRTSTSTSAAFNQTISASSDAITSLAESQASQSSSLTFTGGSLSGVTASGWATANVLASQNDAALADGTSGFILSFTIPSGELYDYTLTGKVEDDGPRASAEAYLYDVNAAQDVFARTGNAGNFNTFGQLGPGEYIIGGTGFATASEANMGSGEGEFGIVLSLTLVPEPASAALLAVAAAGLVGRRKRS